VIFDCAGQPAATALTILMYPDPGIALTVRAYGFDGFEPALAYRYRVSGESGCTTAPAPDGDVIVLPGRPPRTTTPHFRAPRWSRRRAMITPKSGWCWAG
jgi:hypothetical protein